MWRVRPVCEAFFVGGKIMTTEVPHQLSIDEQLEHLKSLGIILESKTREKDLKTISTVGYYKLKEFAMAFDSSEGVAEGRQIHFSNLTFHQLITRYYQDKNLRINVLHAIESIEVYLQNELAAILGEKYGPFGYLKYSNWCDRSIPKFEIEERQYRFKKSLLRQVKKSQIPDIKYSKNLNTDGFPSVWLMIDTLTIGSTNALLSVMSKTNLQILSNKFDCTPSELLSWLGCLNLVRNICCHNSDLVDIKFRTKPMVPAIFSDQILRINNKFSNRIAIAVFIILKLMNSVNAKYDFSAIRRSLNSIINGDEQLANVLGFSNLDSLKSLPKSRTNRHYIHHKNIRHK